MKAIMIAVATLLALTAVAEAAGGVKPNSKSTTSSQQTNKASFFD
jgi:hypothetical protein